VRQTAFHDLRYAFRNLLRTPVFAAAAVLTLSLGIGANTAVFSAMDETLFRPLDFPHADQLADLFTFNKSTQTFLSTSYPDYQDFRARTQTFQTLSAFVRMSLNVKTPGLNQPLPVEAVTGNFFSMLQLPPVAGRMFQNQDDSAAAPPVALIAEDLAGPSAIGTKILIEDQPFTVICSVRSVCSPSSSPPSGSTASPLFPWRAAPAKSAFESPSVPRLPLSCAKYSPSS
jgi:hypothetical protein